MSLKDRSSFSGAGITAPNLNGAIASMNNIGNLITDEQKQRATAQQYAIQNKMMQDRLNIAQAAEQRAADTYQAKLADNKAVNEALQNQVYNPEVLSGVEKVYENIDKNYEGQAKLDMYDKANAMMMPNDQLSAAITTPLSSQAYQQRVMGDLGNASPAARAQALALSKAMYPDTGDKYAKERAKAIAKADANYQTAVNQAILDNKVKITTGGTGSTASGTGGAGTKGTYSDMAFKFLNQNKIESSPFGFDYEDIQGMSRALDSGKPITIDGKDYKLSKKEFQTLLQVSMDPPDNWIQDRKFDSDKLIKGVKDIAGKMPTSSSSSNIKKTVTLNTGAQARLKDNYNTALNNIARLYPTPTSKTPKDVVDKLFKGLFDKETKTDMTKRANNIKNQPVKQPYGSATLQVAMATPKGSADVAKLLTDNLEGFMTAYEAATPAEQGKINKALSSKASKEYFNNIQQTPLGGDNKITSNITPDKADSLPSMSDNDLQNIIATQLDNHPNGTRMSVLANRELIKRYGSLDNYRNMLLNKQRAARMRRVVTGGN